MGELRGNAWQGQWESYEVQAHMWSRPTLCDSTAMHFYARKILCSPYGAETGNDWIHNQTSNNPTATT